MSSSAKHPLEELKALLLMEEQGEQKELRDNIEALHAEISVKERLERHVEPILEERFLRFRREFPQEYQRLIIKSFRKELQENPKEMQELLYPIVRDLVARFFNERWHNLKAGIGLAKSKPKDPTQLYNEQIEYPSNAKAQLSDVFVIENKSLELLGVRSLYEGRDNETTRMLMDNVQNYVREAHERGSQSLDWIEYNGYKIYIIIFKRISMACAVTGNPDKKYRSELEDQVMEFAKDLLPELHEEDRNHSTKITSRLLRSHFRLL